MKKLLAFILGFLMLVSTSGCINQNSGSTQTSITITDMLGRSVELPAHVTKIVAAGPGALRLMVYLNASDMVVGVEDFEKRYNFGRPYILAHPELRKLPTIGPGGPGRLPNFEELVKLKPDVIFITYVDAKTADNIQAKTGIPVVVLSYGKHAAFKNDPFFKSIEIAGKVLGKEKRAEELISFIEKVQSDLLKRTEGIKSPTVYVGGIGYKGAHGIESTEVKFPPFTAVRANNVADELGGWGHKFIDKEQLLKWNPDYLFLDEGGMKLILADYKKNPNFYRSLKAVKNGNVYGILPFNFYATNIGTAMADAYFVGKILYPERFADIDPTEKANEIYTFLVGKPVYEELSKQFGGFGKMSLDSGNITYALPTSP
ncbi:iron ABC transporter substrate-binding protein [Thermococcus sp.]